MANQNARTKVLNKGQEFSYKAETLSEDEEQEHMCVRSQIELH